MYKFEVHRNQTNPKTADYSDMIRYDNDQYVFERNITPAWNDLAFKWERDEGRFFFRKKLDGEFTLNGSDYDWANDIRIDDTEKNIYRLVKILEELDEANRAVWGAC